MKKLITIILAVALILPTAALAEKLDKIIGSWYMLSDRTVVPETTFGPQPLIIGVYSFMEDGSILITQCSIDGNDGNAVFAVGGQWEKQKSDYHFKLQGYGEGKAYIKDNFLFIQMAGTNIYMKLRKMEPFNPSKDYVKK